MLNVKPTRPAFSNNVKKELNLISSHEEMSLQTLRPRECEVLINLQNHLQSQFGKKVQLMYSWQDSSVHVKSDLELKK